MAGEVNKIAREEARKLAQQFFAQKAKDDCCVQPLKFITETTASLPDGSVVNVLSRGLPGTYATGIKVSENTWIAHVEEPLSVDVGGGDPAGYLLVHGNSAGDIYFLVEGSDKHYKVPEEWITNYPLYAPPTAPFSIHKFPLYHTEINGVPILYNVANTLSVDATLDPIVGKLGTNDKFNYVGWLYVAAVNYKLSGTAITADRFIYKSELRDIRDFFDYPTPDPQVVSPEPYILYGPHAAAGSLSEAKTPVVKSAVVTFEPDLSPTYYQITSTGFATNTQDVIRIVNSSISGIGISEFIYTKEQVIANSYVIPTNHPVTSNPTIPLALQYEIRITDDIQNPIELDISMLYISTRVRHNFFRIKNVNIGGGDRILNYSYSPTTTGELNVSNPNNLVYKPIRNVTITADNPTQGVRVWGIASNINDRSELIPSVTTQEGAPVTYTVVMQAGIIPPASFGTIVTRNNEIRTVRCSFDLPSYKREVYRFTLTDFFNNPKIDETKIEVINTFEYVRERDAEDYDAVATFFDRIISQNTRMAQLTGAFHNKKYTLYVPGDTPPPGTAEITPDGVIVEENTTPYWNYVSSSLTGAGAQSDIAAEDFLSTEVKFTDGTHYGWHQILQSDGISGGSFRVESSDTYPYHFDRDNPFSLSQAPVAGGAAPNIPLDDVYFFAEFTMPYIGQNSYRKKVLQTGLEEEQGRVRVAPGTVGKVVLHRDWNGDVISICTTKKEAEIYEYGQDRSMPLPAFASPGGNAFGLWGIYANFSGDPNLPADYYQATWTMDVFETRVLHLTTGSEDIKVFYPTYSDVSTDSVRFLTRKFTHSKRDHVLSLAFSETLFTTSVSDTVEDTKFRLFKNAELIKEFSGQERISIALAKTFIIFHNLFFIVPVSTPLTGFTAIPPRYTIFPNYSSFILKPDKRDYVVEFDIGGQIFGGKDENGSPINVFFYLPQNYRLSLEKLFAKGLATTNNLKKEQLLHEVLNPNPTIWTDYFLNTNVAFQDFFDLQDQIFLTFPDSQIDKLVKDGFVDNGGSVLMVNEFSRKSQGTRVNRIKDLYTTGILGPYPLEEE